MTAAHQIVTRAVLDLEHADTAAASESAPPTRLTGRAVPYDTTTDIGPYTEDIARGAFAESIRENPAVPLFLYHADTNGAPAGTTPHPVGVATAWDERRDGLYGTWRFADTPDAQEAARLVADDVIRGLSVRFIPDPAGSRWSIRDRREHVTRTRARLVSVSLTATPAYATATITGVRAADDGHRAALDKVRTLALDVGDPVVESAITGTVDDIGAACGLVWSTIETHGATDAPGILDDLAAGIRDARPGLAANLARAAACIHPEHVSDQLRAAHIDYYRRGLDTTTAPRRRRRRR